MINRKIDRRRTLRLAGAAIIALPLASAPALAETDFPTRTITFICAFPAGSGADVKVRWFADKVSQISGQTVVVENRAGAAGNLAAEHTMRSDPDGYTVYVHAGTTMAGNFHLWNDPPLDPRTDLRGVAGINEQPFHIVVAADSPFETIHDLNAFLLEAGENATYSTTATSGRVLGAAYLNELGASAVEVQYGTGAETLVDLLGGALDFSVTDPATAMANHVEGRTRSLAHGASERMTGAPGIPTLAEIGLDIHQQGWWAAFVPAATSDEVVYRLSDMFREAVEMDDTAEFLRLHGGDPWVATPEEVDARMIQSVEEWAYLVEMADLPRN